MADLIQVIQRASDQRYWVRGYDCADQWTTNPLGATDVSGYIYLRDAVDGIMYAERDLAVKFKVKGYDIVEFKITPDATGRTLYDLYKDDMSIDEWGREQCRAGMHSWVDDGVKHDPEFVCERPGCKEEYGWPD